MKKRKATSKDANSIVNILTIQWQEALPIRHRVLWPNKQPSFCKVDGDESAIHYGAYIDGELICVASIYIEGRTARLRKFATLPPFQGKGVGSLVIAHVVKELKVAGVDCFWCDARKTAVGFYRRFGLEIQGHEFNKSGIPYYKMEIKLRT
ncbi:GNAT family N-acetyltransferase [Moritella sp. 5]|uniref:GNAT family N-acetyltransferase n=1 Tax=Moritella sp. 5 TaxID=2746231 RepID=UPI001BACD666